MKYNLIRPATHYLNAINSVGCNALIDKPTRVTSDTASCIDHALSNLDQSSFENHIILSEVSDHFGTLSKIGGISKETENLNTYFTPKFKVFLQKLSVNIEIASKTY